MQKCKCCGSNFYELAENDMKVNFRDKKFVIATVFRNYCYSIMHSAVLALKSTCTETF